MSEAINDQLVVTSDTKHLMIVRDFVGRMIRQSLLANEEENKIILAVDEAVSNIIEHGYESGQEGSIEILITSDEKRFQIVIRDSGKVFDPDGISDPNIENHVARGKRRGLGIFLMRQIMDEVRYRFQDGSCNELTLVRYINS